MVEGSRDRSVWLSLPLSFLVSTGWGLGWLLHGAADT
jgi:hypothetical protein